MPSPITVIRLRAAHGEHYARKVKRDGRAVLGRRYSYVQQALAGQQVTLEVDADTGEVVVWHKQEPIKRMPLKGLANQPLAFEAFVEQLREEACQEWRRYQATHHTGRPTG